MKLDGATIVIEPRSVAGCIDLAAAFYRVHASSFFRLTAIFAVPACALTYRLASNTDSALTLGLLVYFLVSPSLGAAVVAAAGPAVFGDPLSTRRALRLYLRNCVSLTFLQLLSRMAIGFFSCVGLLPGLWLAVRYGFLAEIVLLERPAAGTERRIAELTRDMVQSLAVRGVVIVAFFACAVVSLFTLVDSASNVILGAPLLMNRASSLFAFEETLDLLVHDPLAVTALLAVLWLVYPLARLAWFFCYLDVRIRKECWDLELDFRIEARRLAAAESFGT